MDMETQNLTMEDVMKNVEENSKRIDSGDIVEGKVVSVKDTEAVINIGFYADGILTVADYSDEVEVLTGVLEAGDTIKVMVVKVDDGEGNVVLSKKKADQIVAWEDLDALYKSQKEITLKVASAVKGGVIVNYKGVRGFIPASLLSVDFVSDLKAYEGTDLAVKLVEYDQEKKKVIFSHKVIEEVERAKKREELLSSIEKGQRLSGKVASLKPFGAFVDLGGLTGLVHNNDLSWKRIKHPSEVVKEKDVVEVYVIDVDRATGKIALGLKDVNDNPWVKIAETLHVGDVLEGKVMRLLSFGAIVQLESGLEGLVHISEIDEKRVTKVEEVLEVGEAVKVKVMKIDTKAEKLSLSIKGAKEEEARASIPSEYKEEQDLGSTLGDLFNIKLD